jgi:hypothetical protein
MAKDNGPAQWTAEDEVILIDFLLLHAAAAGDGGNFKMVTFNGAAPVVDAKRAKGGPKTGKACQNKYNSVCSNILHVLKCAELLLIASPNFSCHTSHQEQVWLDLE